MISLKQYLDGELGSPVSEEELPKMGNLTAALAAYGSALLGMGNCSLEACPGLGDELKLTLRKFEERLNVTMSRQAIETTDKDVQERLREWGRRTARHYREKASEARELLLIVAHTSESLGARDERCAGQMRAVTDRLRTIASLEDLTEIRTSIEKSTAELKSSIQRMTEEGKAAVERLRKQVSTYEARLEAAEELTSRDMLTKVRSRVYVECEIERRIAAQRPFCVAVVDINGFKKINDKLGHLAGDEALKQFAGELKAACRSTDIIGRWGGDEFLILLDSGLAEASAQIARLRKWVCGSYTISSPLGQKKIELNASIGLAECAPDETIKQLLTRADAAMYAQKSVRHDGAQ